MKEIVKNNFYNSIKEVLEAARRNIYRTANFVMVQAYWNIGRLIIEEEQSGEKRAEYGKQMIKELSIKLTRDFGKGFTRTNLWYMRQFYSTFSNLHALREELSMIELIR